MTKNTRKSALILAVGMIMLLEMGVAQFAQRHPQSPMPTPFSSSMSLHPLVSPNYYLEAGRRQGQASGASSANFESAGGVKVTHVHYRGYTGGNGVLGPGAEEVVAHSVRKVASSGFSLRHTTDRVFASPTARIARASPQIQTKAAAAAAAPAYHRPPQVQDQDTAAESSSVFHGGVRNTAHGHSSCRQGYAVTTDRAQASPLAEPELEVAWSSMDADMEPAENMLPEDGYDARISCGDNHNHNHNQYAAPAGAAASSDKDAALLGSSSHEADGILMCAYSEENDEIACRDGKQAGIDIEQHLEEIRVRSASEESSAQQSAHEPDSLPLQFKISVWVAMLTVLASLMLLVES